MMYAYRPQAGKLARVDPAEPLTDAIWVDLYHPQPKQVEAVTAYGIEVPTLADMEEIEISNRLYRENGADYMTVVLPGMSDTKTPMVGPVTFILTPAVLVTVRHHVPRPFETYPTRAERLGLGCATPDQVFLGLFEEIVGRLADLLESAGRGLDQVSRAVFLHGDAPRAETLKSALDQVGREGELLGRVRLSLLTIERAISFFLQTQRDRSSAKDLAPVVKGLLRDVQALGVHADFVASRVAMVTDATLGMINLAQNATVRIVSVVAALFLPPTLIASIYGMNFDGMPELHWTFGYPMALGLMIASALVTYLFFRWRNWL